MSALLSKRQAINRHALLLPFLISLIPLAVLPGFGNSFSEPKFVVVSILMATLLCARQPLSLPHEGRLWWQGFALLLLAAGISFLRVENFGQGLQSLSLLLTIFFLPLLIAQSGIPLEKMLSFLVIPLALVLVGALSMVLFRTPIFLNYSPFGSSIGLKNSLSVFLAQLVPLLLISICDMEKPACWSKHRPLQIFICVLLVLCIWIALLHRTRSAWWMLIFYFLSYAALSVFCGREYKRYFLTYCFAGAAALILLCSIPTQLVWTSRSPFRDSLYSLFSLKYSSGRDSLWRVALEMIKAHPLFGVGAGQYPLLWPKFVPVAGVDAKVFSVIRADLPLFNDYLQYVVELGILGGMLFSVFILAVPVICARQSWKDSRSMSLILVCLATAIDAFVDSPFNRPETVTFYAIALGYALPKKSGETPERCQFGRILAAAFFAIFALQMLIGLGAKMLWQSSQRVDELEVALKVWPWDIQWRREQLIGALKARRKDLAKSIVQQRKVAWPEDAESYLLEGRMLEYLKQFSNAQESYHRALTLVPGGDCYPPAADAYRKMRSRKMFPANLPPLSPEELAVCD